MKSIITFSLCCFLGFNGFAQEIRVTFYSDGAATVIDSIIATNQRTNQRVTFPGNASLFLRSASGIADIPEVNDYIAIFPNPFSGESKVVVTISKNQKVNLRIHNVIGQVVAQTSEFLQSGSNEFILAVDATGIYTIILETGEGTESRKALCVTTGGSVAAIQYIGFAPVQKNASYTSGNKSLQSGYSLDYSNGDIIHYSCYSGVMTTIITDIPTSSRIYKVEFAECTDPGGKHYKIVAIGGQTWMAENLAYLPEVSPSSIGSASDKHYYVYGYEGTKIFEATASPNYQIYGVLYNWPAAMNGSSSSTLVPSEVQGICPEGWHLPSYDEWTKLAEFLTKNGYGYGGNVNDIGKSISSNSGWLSSPIQGAVGNSQETNNRSGFTIFPGGSRSGTGGYYGLHEKATFWSTSTKNETLTYDQRIFYDANSIGPNFGGRANGASVRCVKDYNSGISEAYVDMSLGSLQSYDTLTGNALYNFAGYVPELSNGSIIVIDADTTGFLRKVVSSQTTGGDVRLQTQPAFFNDVFPGLDFKLKTEWLDPDGSLKSVNSTRDISKALTDEEGYIHPVEIIYRDSIGNPVRINAFNRTKTQGEGRERIIDIEKDFSNTDLYGEEGDHARFYIDEGNAFIKSDAVFEFNFDYTGEMDETTKVKKGDLTTFMYYLETDAGFKSKLALLIQDSYKKEEKERIYNGPKITAKFFVGPVPIWISFDVDYFAKYSLNVDASLNINWGFESTHNLKIGCLYTKATDNIDPINEYDSTNVVYPLTADGKVNLEARLEFYPRIEMKFYSFFGPYAEVAPYIAANYNAALHGQITDSGTETFLAWNSGLNLGMDFRVGAELTFLWGLFNKNFGPEKYNCFEDPLWRSPEKVNLLTKLPEEIDAGSKITLHYLVTDLANQPARLCPVYLDGDGTISKQLPITGLDGTVTIDWTLPTIEGNSSVKATIFNSKKEEINSTNSSVKVKGSGGGDCIDADGRSYKTVQIGTQVWMAENLAYLPSVSSSSSGSDTSPYYYVWGYAGSNVTSAKSDSNYLTYGVLYNWAAANTVCPINWHLPSDAEWITLTDYLISNSYGYGGIGSAIGKAMAAKFGWTAFYGNGTVGNDPASNNRSGFSALPGGYRHYDGRFYDIGNEADFWSSSMSTSSLAISRGLIYNSGLFNYGQVLRSWGLSVRCIKNGTLPNNRPNASFTINPIVGTTTTVFQFDASGSTDLETPAEQLQVRWDWENDGTWDTSYSTTKTETHQYPQAGTYNVLLEVKDGGGLTDTEIHQVTVTAGPGGDGTFDYDGRTYAYKTIGTQTWMIENLAFLPSVSRPYDGTDTSPFYYVQGYQGSSVSEAKGNANYTTYGVLYNWEAAKTACPPGWHLPTDDEWKILEKNQGMSETDANSIGYRNSGTVNCKLKESGTTHWRSPNTGATNSSGFTALPGGSRIYTGGFGGLGSYAYFWSSSENGSSDAWGRYLAYDGGGVDRYSNNRRGGYSVRCLKN